MRYNLPANDELTRTLERLRPEWRSQGALIHAAFEYARSYDLPPIKFEADTRIAIWVPGELRSGEGNGYGELTDVAGKILAALRTEDRAARVPKTKPGMFDLIPILVPETLTWEAKHRAFGKGWSRAEALADLARRAVPEVVNHLAGITVPREQMKPQVTRHQLAILEGWESVVAACKPLRLDPDTVLILKMDEIQRRRRP